MARIALRAGGVAPDSNLRLPIVHEDLILAPEEWLEANLSYEFLSAFLDLVAARMEANPKLRSNAHPSHALKLLHTIHEDLWCSVESRAAAREFVDEPAGAYFERRYRAYLATSG